MRPRRLLNTTLLAAALGLGPLPALADQAAAPAAAAPAASADAAAPAPATTVLAPAAPGRPAAPAPAAPLPGPSAGNLLQTIFALTLVLGVLFALAWFMKRYGPKAGSGSANLNVVGALNLGGRERIIVVEVGDQWIVVGASPGRINALATMPRQEGAPGQATLAEHAPPAGNFSQWLKQTIDKRNAK